MNTPPIFPAPVVAAALAQLNRDFRDIDPQEITLSKGDYSVIAVNDPVRQAVQ